MLTSSHKYCQLSIISKSNISLFRLPLFIVLSETITFVITMGIFIGFLIAQLTVFIRDLKEFTTITMQLWFWFTPIVYVISIVPDSLSQLIIYNPVYQFIHVWHSVFLHQTIPDMTGIIVLTIVAHIILLAAFLMYRALEKDIRDFL